MCYLVKYRSRGNNPAVAGSVSFRLHDIRLQSVNSPQPLSYRTSNFVVRVRAAKEIPSKPQLCFYADKEKLLHT